MSHPERLQTFPKPFFSELLAPVALASAWSGCVGGPSGRPTHTSTPENDEPRSGEESEHERLQTIQRSSEKSGMTHKTACENNDY